MAIPSTGGPWATNGYADVDSRLLERGGTVAVLIRDYRGSATNMSPSGFSPFAADGQPRTDMFAVKLQNGVWTVNGATNQGWWNFGAFSERNGPEKRATVRNDDYMILQSNWPYDSSLISEGVQVRLTPVDTLKPAIDRIRNNLPLTDSTGAIVVDPFGEPGYFVGKPVESEAVERQLLLLRETKKGGKTVVTATGYPLVKLTDIGNAKMDKQAADAPELGFTALPDPYFVDQSGVPVIQGHWVAGAGWLALAPGS
jgi:hypothetical protein